jgi:hypothetical protein
VMCSEFSDVIIAAPLKNGKGEVVLVSINRPRPSGVNPE